MKGKISSVRGILTSAVAAGALAMFGWTPAAHAALFQTSYTFDVDYCTTGCLNGGTGGTVTLAADGTNTVLVTVSLDSGFNFHDAGLTSFVFNLTGISGSVTYSNISNAAFVDAGTGIHEDGAGTFGFGLNCATCGPSNNDISVSSLSFDVTATGLTTDSFHLLSSGGSPDAYFAAAVFNVANTSCTGVIGADGGTTPSNGGSNDGTGACGSSPTPPAVPEPNSLALLGTALAVLGLMLRRRRYA